MTLGQVLVQRFKKKEMHEKNNFYKNIWMLQSEQIPLEKRFS